MNHACTCVSTCTGLSVWVHMCVLTCRHTCECYYYMAWAYECVMEYVCFCVHVYGMHVLCVLCECVYMFRHGCVRWYVYADAQVCICVRVHGCIGAGACVTCMCKPQPWMIQLSTFSMLHGQLGTPTPVPASLSFPPPLLTAPSQPPLQAPNLLTLGKTSAICSFRAYLKAENAWIPISSLNLTPEPQALCPVHSWAAAITAPITLD